MVLTSFITYLKPYRSGINVLNSFSVNCDKFWSDRSRMITTVYYSVHRFLQVQILISIFLFVYMYM